MENVGEESAAWTGEGKDREIGRAGKVGYEAGEMPCDISPVDLLVLREPLT